MPLWALMKSTFEERSLGRVEVREIFHVPKVGTIAGCYVTDGKIERGRPHPFDPRRYRHL